MTVQILDPAIWHSVPIAPMPLLEDLGTPFSIRSTTRMPKWKFRVEPDVVMQIQPRPDTRTKANPQGLPWFDCQAVIRDDVTGAMSKDPPPESWKMNFRILITDPWLLKVCRYGCGTGCTSDAALVVRDRLVAVMSVAFKRGALRLCSSLPSRCGRLLTHPESMAR